ncbi:ABC transporter permease [Actinomadura sp. BRA 177]|uniref:ABC transporter permease n=1 Tax=Actinomadura sp. BRA 177 TaxID=2745202 RepID=UPI001C3C8419|nr:ABC transporter permease [Actinomadura sp. BRA 177]
MKVRRRSTARPVEQTTRLSFYDVVMEAVDAVLSRPGRAALTALGTLLGVAAFVSVLGLTATASGQISANFTRLEATQVIVEDQATGDHSLAFPADAEQRIAHVNGVRAAGVFWDSGAGGRRVSARPAAQTDEQQQLRVFAASPGLLPALHARVSTGRAFDNFSRRTRQQVCLLGATAAKELGITDLTHDRAVFIEGRAFVVMGIFDNVDRMPETLLSVIVPDATYTALWGPPQQTEARMLIDTRLGAAAVVASQAPVALRPDNPSRLHALPPLSPTQLKSQVNDQLQGLFLVLAAICLAIGGVGIANTTLVAVLERVGEIGLRRALGGRRHHVALQFLIESATLGLLGAMAGTSIGVATVIGVAWAKDWTPLLAPETVLPAPFVGAITGLVAGLYPAWRASRIEPAEALRR